MLTVAFIADKSEKNGDADVSEPVESKGTLSCK